MWVVMWVDYQPVDVEIECDSIRILVFEMWIGMNKFWLIAFLYYHHLSLHLRAYNRLTWRPAPIWPDSSACWVLHRHRRGLGSNPRSGLNFPGLSRCCPSSAKIHSFRSAFQIQECLYYPYSQISCHFFDQLYRVKSNIKFPRFVGVCKLSQPMHGSKTR